MPPHSKPGVLGKSVAKDCEHITTHLQQISHFQQISQFQQITFPAESGTTITYSRVGHDHHLKAESGTTITYSRVGHDHHLKAESGYVQATTQTTDACDEQGGYWQC